MMASNTWAAFAGNGMNVRRNYSLESFLTVLESGVRVLVIEVVSEL